MKVSRIFWGKSVEKQLDRIPTVIARKFRLWVVFVEESGIREVRKQKGFHDEPLHGKRKGQRSVRLNKAYRAIYIEHENQKLKLIEVIEVNKHEY